MLVSALAELLWKARAGRAVIAVPTTEVCLLDPPLTFMFDGITEKVSQPSPGIACLHCSPAAAALPLRQ